MERTNYFFRDLESLNGHIALLQAARSMMNNPAVEATLPAGILELLKICPEDVSLAGPYDMGVPNKPGKHRWQYVLSRRVREAHGHGVRYGDGTAERVTFVNADASHDDWLAHITWILEAPAAP